MKTFRSFINEQMTLKPGFVLSRDQMPQIKNIDHFVNFIERQDIDVSREEECDVSSLRPTQFEYDKYKVYNIKMDWRKDPGSVSNTAPIIASQDGFVLDGHHRYFAAHQSGTYIPCITVHLDINKLLRLSMDYKDMYG